MISTYQLFATLLVLLNFILPLYLLIILLIKYPPLQRWVLYYHKGFSPLSSPPTTPVLDNPEVEGFLLNQVTSHFIPTSDGEKLHSWLILPLGAYTTHQAIISRPWEADETREIALQTVRADSKAMVVLYLHGNGNNLATENRCAAYRNLSQVSSKHLYVLAFDYRGFGNSTGVPTEEGLIVDALSVLAWIVKTLGVPKTRTLLVGQSLGCAVAVAAARRIAEKDRYSEYAGFLLCAGFTDIARLAVEFRVGGMVRLLAPLKWTKWTRGLLERKVLHESWKTEQRLMELVGRCDVLRISILHAEDDDRTPWEMAEALYDGCAREVGKTESTEESEVSLGRVGSVKEIRAGGKLVRRVLLKYGGHNQLMKWSTVAFEAARLLKAAGASE